MRNEITIDVNNPYYYRLSSTEGEDSIIINYLNHSVSGICEIFYRDSYQEELLIQDGSVELPQHSYSDGCIVHVRYKNGRKTSFLHIVGDASKYENLILRKQGECIAVIDGKLEKKEEVNLWEKIAAIISQTLKPDGTACCDTLETLRQEMVKQLNHCGIEIEDKATVEEIADSLKSINVQTKRDGDMTAIRIEIKDYELIGEV
ncbi:MAG: hypothetical protein NC489_43735 [Ruminococcus flavefaciens]|nr:hypothetical protein [Ruminococcus flavefaciens]